MTKSPLAAATFCAALLLTLCLSHAHAAPEPARDFLTPKEEELVKAAQVLDKRIEVFIKAADRRLLVIFGQKAPAEKQSKKEAELWGDLPEGSRADLINDIARILDAAVTNIDDVALRDEKNSLIPKALRKLADAAARIESQLGPVRQQTKDEAERAAIGRVEVNAAEILEAAGRLQPAPEKK